ncbi:hypothetical protein SynROS8604_01315 [Synechococcus sp. ROS8604]|nr:hypothetical protein SynROS8604_01315 [Synechococcus sp. ROS8604]
MGSRQQHLQALTIRHGLDLRPVSHRGQLIADHCPKTLKTLRRLHGRRCDEAAQSAHSADAYSNSGLSKATKSENPLTE